MLGPPPHRRSVRVRLADRPGSLHRLTSIMAEAGVNIVRLEIVSSEGLDVWDDIELAAPHLDQLAAVVTAMKGMGLTVVSLPGSWVTRDWAVEVLGALESLSACPDPRSALRRFAEATVTLTQTRHAFVLMEPQPPNTELATARWELLRAAAAEVEPESVSWSGEVGGVKLADAALRAARSDVTGKGSQLTGAVGAVVPIPAPGGRPARLVVVGSRPPFLPTEVGRLELFARVAAPHIVSTRWAASA